MTDDDLPRPKPSDALTALTREDLGRLSVDEVQARITSLRAEIALCEARLAESGSVKAAANALFRHHRD
ncbi:MAG: DUF1192 domain-containing protein [Sphingomonadaceae bacterium]|nr:DUF1192 domain-containing protein [Sphingomonadaceae bacterium]